MCLDLKTTYVDEGLALCDQSFSRAALGLFSYCLSE